MKDISRREFVNHSAMGVLAAGTLLGAGTNAFAENGGKRKPNILFIMTDQQHARMMSCAGNAWLKTPALDRLARGGVRFERAYCSNPVCVPSRTSMATGVMSCRLGADNNGSGMKIKQLPPEVDAHSMGKIMKHAGYDTFYGGKVHMCGALAPRSAARRPGGTKENRKRNRRPRRSTGLRNSKQKENWDGRITADCTRGEEGCAPCAEKLPDSGAGYDEFDKDSRDVLPAACLKFIKTKRANPFFAVASFINPHDICFAHLARNGKDRQGVLALHKKASTLPLEQLPPLPDNYAIQKNEPSAIEANLGTRAVTPAITMRKEYDAKAWRINRWIYHRLTEKVDKNIGRILDGLKDAGLEDNTVVIFTSDHGNMDASHRLASKGLFYEESVGVPLIVRYPKSIPAGRTDREHLISTGLDILPTMCDYAGVKKPKHLLGMSLRPVAEGKRVENWRTYVASENRYTRMIRSRKYKYCAFNDPNSKESLVDMENDPGEMQNLVDDPRFKTVLAEHRKLLADWSKLSGDKDASEYLRKDEQRSRGDS